jgi:ubiquinone/menaquinone biosynthesis C-methylase UbiE
MAKAKAKPDLQGVAFVEGDAEDLPLPTDAFDRYTSAGSIEYWPEPQRGVCEAYRVLRPGGWACLIGPVEPTSPVSKFFQGEVASPLFLPSPPPLSSPSFFLRSFSLTFSSSKIKTPFNSPQP